MSSNSQSVCLTGSAAGAILAAFLLAAPAGAAPLFFDDFESDLSKWFAGSSGQIVADPFDGTNSVLNFTARTTGGDIFSNEIVLEPGQHYAIAFDYYGDRSNDQGSGGYAGIAAGTPGDHTWYAGSDPVLYPDSLYLKDDAGWLHYVYDFVAPVSLGGSQITTIRLMFQDYFFAGNDVGNTYFDNVSLTAVPLPPAIGLFGAGIAGLGLFGWLRRSKAGAG